MLKKIDGHCAEMAWQWRKYLQCKQASKERPVFYIQMIYYVQLAFLE
ncbi:hypothetical protein BSBH6_03761 [Bacillus subtilis]|nr:hypothetical protein BSBH6_03761 [Bacillus subtilis]RPK20638.1 hypothetical protein BH5_03855 [Bacillus subtilis]